MNGFSPLTWGCSDDGKQNEHGSAVFPTHVGMFRPYHSRSPTATSFPHSRGDVPSSQSRFSSHLPFSPLTWGCSGLSIRGSRNERVFPTHVGMFRSRDFGDDGFDSFPHSRGDVPRRRDRSSRSSRFSPLTWGCSAHNRRSAVRQFVFPTHVGMFRGASLI